jgi:hypothetical protein
MVLLPGVTFGLLEVRVGELEFVCIGVLVASRLNCVRSTAKMFEPSPPFPVPQKEWFTGWEMKASPVAKRCFLNSETCANFKRRRSNMKAVLNLSQAREFGMSFPNFWARPACWEWKISMANAPRS